MPLATGSRIGVYEIIAAIGSGGMGEVYRARDTKLNRDVAIKILPEAFTQDSERLARFKREAQVLASLNHPNIAAIYGFEDSGGVHALVLELVEGRTLDELIAGKPLPLDEAVGLARQIAEALEAAHGQNIIHRDLKPANIKVRDDGVVKVLDFGLAKATNDAGATTGALHLTNSPTITSPTMMTSAGMILGTAAYMSPEQAKGRQADKRSDIWSFGCVLYEMLTGKRAFEGEDVSDTLAAVLRGHPEWTALPVDVPAAARLMLQRTLEKDRSKRIGDVSTIRFVLSEPTLNVDDMRTANLPARSSNWWARAALVFGSATVGALLFGLAATQSRTPAAQPIVTRFTYRIPEGQRFTNAGRKVVAVSPDGAHIAYVANQSLYLKAMWDAEGTSLTATQAAGGITSPVFSPDGQWIAYWAAASRSLNKIAITGGAPIKIAEVDNPAGMSWTGDNLLVGSTKGVLSVSEKGGTPEVVIPVEQDQVALAPQMLPAGRSVLFTLASGSGAERWDKADIVVQTIRSSDRKTILRGGTDAEYVDAGYLVYALGGTLFAEPFDIRRLEATGPARSAVDGVSRSALTGSAQYAVSRGGDFVYVPGPTTAAANGFEVALLERSGTVERLKLERHAYQSPRFSPNGQQLALSIDDGANANVWIYDLTGKQAIRQLTFGGNNRFPIWTADGQRIAFQSDREGDDGIFWQRADGNGAAERLTKAQPGETHTPDSWSPYGDVLLFSIRTSLRAFQLRIFSRRDNKVAPFADVQSNGEPNANFSPDGRAVVYATAVGTGSTVWVRPFPLTDVKYRIGEGITGYWAPDGKSVYFVANPGAPAFSNVSVTLSPSFALGTPSSFPRPPTTGAGPNLPRAYDIAPNNQQMVVFVGDTATIDPQINVVLHWFEELKRLVPAK